MLLRRILPPPRWPGSHMKVTVRDAALRRPVGRAEVRNCAWRAGRAKFTRGFSVGVTAQHSSRGLVIKTLTFAAAGGVGAGLWFARQETQQIEEEVDLPSIPEPTEFVHPYEVWPWYRKAWFTLKRSVVLAWIFAPFMYASTLTLIYPDCQTKRDRWLEEMLACCQRAGAAFQKFGQWLSMRPDMFPPDVIDALAQLRTDAPSHASEITRMKIEEQLGKSVEEMFDEFDDVPVASGSVGQVHKGRLRAEFALDGPGGKLRDVAVKVQHPGVVDSAFMDLSIVWKIVDVSQAMIHMTLPFSRGEFDTVIQAQMDFTREAFNLQQFARNFKGEPRIRFPKVSPEHVTPSVLIETWAEGKVISNILEDFDNAKETCKDAICVLGEKKRELQGKLCNILYDMNMKMMVRDNFVHGDLHGGNILYSEEDNHVTVLDAGIATSLDKQTFAPFKKFLHALCSGKSDIIVEYLQIFNEAKANIDIDGFKRDIESIMEKFMGPFRVNPDGPVNAADMFGEVMFSMQRHQMLMKGDVASTLFTISISEGLIRQLDPSFDVATSALPYIVRNMPSLLLAE